MQKIFSKKKIPASCRGKTGMIRRVDFWEIMKIYFFTSFSFDFSSSSFSFSFM